MADTITWVRPSGSEITTSGDEATIKYAAQLGWKPKGVEKPEVEKAKPGRPKKDQ